VSDPIPTPAQGTPTSSTTHRVSFHETDAMQVMHHSNYLKLFEDARVVWLDEYDQSYTKYVELDLHFAVTCVEANYHRSAVFDDWLEVTTWVEWARGASLRMAYRITRGDDLIASGATEHAAVDSQGRVRRIPKANRERLAASAARAAGGE
jgi:acyl-CoA thioester hydrolase